MKRYLLVSLVVLMVKPGVVWAEMMGGSMGKGTAASSAAQHEMKPEMQSPGMMARGKDVMGGCTMPGGMMGPEMMGAMMPSMMDGMMSGQTRGCMMMAEGMMKGQVDLARIRKALALSDEQVERLRAGQRPFQKETILTLASLKVAELELADLIAAEKADFGMIEVKLKEIEGMRTKIRLAHLKATVAVKGILSTEQLEKFQGAGESAPPAAPAPGASQQGVTPPTDFGHEQHH